MASMDFLHFFRPHASLYVVMFDVKGKVNFGMGSGGRLGPQKLLGL